MIINTIEIDLAISIGAIQEFDNKITIINLIAAKKSLKLLKSNILPTGKL